MKHTITTRCLASPNWGRSQFSRKVWSSYEPYSLLAKWIMNTMLIESSYRSLLLCWLLSLECSSCFDHVVQSLLTHVFVVSVLRAILDHIPSNEGVLIRKVTNKDCLPYSGYTSSLWAIDMGFQSTKFYFNLTKVWRSYKALKFF